jgi:AcrR family transcriptional regulator
MRTRDPKKEKALRDKAFAMIVKEGFDGLSMQKLAKAAGVSPATIYIYYKDRDDLILQLYAYASHRMSEQTLRNFDPESSFKDGLRVQWINRAE